MADENQSSKTEEPTERRRDEAKKKGQFAISSELTGSLLLLSAVLVLSWSGNNIGTSLARIVRNHLFQLNRGELNPAQTHKLITETVLGGIETCGLLLCVLFLTAISVGVLQVGFNVSFESLQANWSKLSPISGSKRLFSLRSVVHTLISITKVCAIVAVLWWLAHSSQVFGNGLGFPSLLTAVRTGWGFAIHFAMAVAGFLIMIALADVVFQRWRHEQELKMSHQEIKEEQKQELGDPLMRARIKKLQREASQRRMLDDVPNATVVVTNPTHYAVALQYTRETMQAPKVVAKGKDFLAKRIAKIAKDNDIPILERKPLARALFATVPIGEEIPAELYQAIAEIMVYVYGLKRAA